MRVAGSEVIRDTLGPVAVARGVSNSGLIKPAFFELFPKFFSVRVRLTDATSVGAFARSSEVVMVGGCWRQGFLKSSIQTLSHSDV